MEENKTIRVVGYFSYFISALFSVLGLPLALKLVSPNSMYGVRTQSTLQSAEAWYSVNASAGMALAIAGLFSIVLIYFMTKFVKLNETASVAVISFTPIVIPSIFVAIALIA